MWFWLCYFFLFFPEKIFWGYIIWGRGGAVPLVQNLLKISGWPQQNSDQAQGHSRCGACGATQSGAHHASLSWGNIFKFFNGICIRDWGMPESYLKSQGPLLRRLPRELQAEVTGRKIKIDIPFYYWLGLCTKSAEHFGKQDWWMLPNSKS